MFKGVHLLKHYSSHEVLITILCVWIVCQPGSLLLAIREVLPANHRLHIGLQTMAMGVIVFLTFSNKMSTVQAKESTLDGHPLSERSLLVAC